MSVAPVRATGILAAAVVLVAFAAANAAALEPAFVAMDGERFALATRP